ncbi:hypothetical protein [Rhizobium sp. IMFF44]|uniref:hypothetical protein n=1 Tax=Rhizobium sp. IMFF44 TaxID=3342350 RepID=UPI0035BA981C
MNEEKVCTETGPMRMVTLTRAFLYAYYVGAAMFLFYCEFIVPEAAALRQQSIWQNLEMVLFGPVMLCVFFFFFTIVPASVLIAIGEFLMAGFYYYMIAGVALAISVYWELHGHLPQLLQASRGQPPFEAYLAGSLAASLTFWRFASGERTRMTEAASK